MNNVAKFALLVACVAGYAAPALALNRPQMPASTTAAHANVVPRR